MAAFLGYLITFLLSYRLRFKSKSVAKVAATSRIIIVCRFSSGACGVGDEESGDTKLLGVGELLVVGVEVCVVVGEVLELGLGVAVGVAVRVEVGVKRGCGALNTIEPVRFVIKPALSNI